LRYLREAKVNLSLARRCQSLSTVRELSVIAIKKAQLAVQHALGDPNVIEYAVSKSVLRGGFKNEPFVRLMEKLDLITHKIIDPKFKIGREKILGITEKVFEFSSLIVKEALREETLVLED